MPVCFPGRQALDRTAAILVIGNEILTGKVEETNARWLSTQLFDLGVRLRAIRVVPDEIEPIADAVNQLRSTHDFLFTSGGVGPTHDDMTISGIARALGRDVVRVEPIAELLRRYYGERCNDDVLRMAEAPAGFTLIECADRHWPVLSVENIVILPGVPEIFRRKFESIRERFRSTPFALENVYVTLDEGLIATQLAELAARFPTVAIGSYPTFSHPHYKVKITLESKDASAVAAARSALEKLLPDAIVPAPAG